ncbi:MAG: VOC family protein [Hyphomonadaceae bacterium]
MQQGQLEHVNYTVPDPQKTAGMLADLFGWKVRWEGPAMAGGYTVHVGTETGYVALYRPADPSALIPANDERAKDIVGTFNHLAITVDDLDETEKRILEAGYKTLNHGDYEPGRRFYFYDHDGIEYEVVSYAK